MHKKKEIITIMFFRVLVSLLPLTPIISLPRPQRSYRLRSDSAVENT